MAKGKGRATPFDDGRLDASPTEVPGSPRPQNRTPAKPMRIDDSPTFAPTTTPPALDQSDLPDDILLEQQGVMIASSNRPTFIGCYINGNIGPGCYVLKDGVCVVNNCDLRFNEGGPTYKEKVGRKEGRIEGTGNIPILTIPVK